MSEATRFRRTIVIDRATVERNLALLKEKNPGDVFAVWSERRSGVRFLEGFRTIAASFGIDLVDEQPDREIRLTQLLGGHPMLRNAVALESHLYGVRDVAEGDGVSYGARFIAPESMRVGLAPVGFADGIDRLLTGEFAVSIDGQRVPVIGRIAMDSISLDLRTVPSADLGSVVTVYGSDRNGGTTPAEAAETLGTTSLEIITRLSERAEVVWR